MVKRNRWISLSFDWNGDNSRIILICALNFAVDHGLLWVDLTQHLDFAGNLFLLGDFNEILRSKERLNYDFFFYSVAISVISLINQRLLICLLKKDNLLGKTLSHDPISIIASWMFILYSVAFYVSKSLIRRLLDHTLLLVLLLLTLIEVLDLFDLLMLGGRMKTSKPFLKNDEIAFSEFLWWENWRLFIQDLKSRIKRSLATWRQI